MKITRIKSVAPIIFLSIFFGFLFFYKLDYSTLASWDEAWYGSIARDMLRSGDFLKMVWNGKPYFDHPPLGFWLMAISYKLLGISEFSTRLPSALLGLSAIILVYKTAVELFNKKTVGFVAAMILGTSVWYLIRVRSGNLDSLFVFFYILTVYFSVKSNKNFKWFPMVAFAFGGLVLSKTLVGFSAAAIILYWNWEHLLNLRKNFTSLAMGVFVFCILVLPWYIVQKKSYPDFVEHHFFNIGMRNKTLASYFNLMLQQPLFYIHMGVRKWYYIWLASLAFILVSFRFIKKNIFFLLLWNFIILYPFLTAKETELWHLIPVYLPLGFIVAVGIYEASQLGFHILNRIIYSHSKALRLDKKLLSKATNSAQNLIYLGFFLYVSLIQTRIFYKEVFPADKWIPDDVAISKAAGKYNKPVFLDDDYTPIAVFYSGTNVQPISYLSDDRKTLAKFIESDEKNYVVITRNWVVEDLKDKNIKFKLLQKNNSFSILTKP